MDYQVKIKEYKPQKVAVIRSRVMVNKVSEKFRQLLDETAAYLESKGVKPMGPPVGVYYEVGSVVAEFEAGYPIDKDVEESERVKLKTLPGVKAAAAVYEGDHAEIKAAHFAVHTWMHANGVAASGEPVREVFLADPRSVEAGAAWRVESVWPVQHETRAEKRRKSREDVKSKA